MQQLLEQYSLSLLSGLIGTIVGVFSTMWMTKNAQKVDAIENMLALVHKIGFQTRYSDSTIQPDSLFHENFTELWTAYKALSSTVPFWHRKSLRKEWRKFMVMEGHFDDSNPDYWDEFVKGTHISKEQAVQSCGEFINYIEQLR
ncbi:hypothetical protein [Vibrio mediterranei]|uniref:hypothetical protein n=1 Tax=Vibrio mediterranei TaxID=689 RepID=UPI0040677CC7